MKILIVEKIELLKLDLINEFENLDFNFCIYNSNGKRIYITIQSGNINFAEYYKYESIYNDIELFEHNYKKLFTCKKIKKTFEKMFKIINKNLKNKNEKNIINYDLSIGSINKKYIYNNIEDKIENMYEMTNLINNNSYKNKTNYIQ